MEYGIELMKKLEAEKELLVEAINNRSERIAAGMTDMDDCFFSQRTNENGISGINMKLNILEGDGMMDFNIYRDEDGKDVDVSYVMTKYGGKYVGRGIFASSIKALLKKTGWKEIAVRVPAWVKFCPGSGGGLCAVYTGGDRIVRWHTNMVTGVEYGFDGYEEKKKD